jgi:ribosomal RNA-processing protein 7
MLEKRGGTNQDEACCISSGDEDSSKGMKSMYESYRVLCFSISIS